MGRSAPDLENLALLAELFSCTVDELLIGDAASAGRAAGSAASRRRRRPDPYDAAADAALWAAVLLCAAAMCLCTRYYARRGGSPRASAFDAGWIMLCSIAPVALGPTPPCARNMRRPEHRLRLLLDAHHHLAPSLPALLGPARGPGRPARQAPALTSRTASHADGPARPGGLPHCATISPNRPSVERGIVHVRVEPYSPAWAAQFKAEAARVARALGDALLEVHHIGSTAVPGLAAKPVIDMMPVVRDLASADARRESLEALGYEWCGEFGIPGRRYLRRSSPSDPDLRLFQLHVFSQDSVDDIRRHLAVRDYLRTHADAARAYGALKGRLARRFPEDIDAYCDGKDDFVQHLQHDAVAWMTGRVQSLPVIALRDRPDLIECAAEWFSSIWGVATEDYRASMRTRSMTSSWHGCGRRTHSRSANADASGTEGIDGYHGHVPDPALSKPALLRSGAADDHRAPRARALARRGTCGQASRVTSGMELSSMSFSRYVASRLSQNSGVVPVPSPAATPSPA